MHVSVDVFLFGLLVRWFRGFRARSRSTVLQQQRRVFAFFLLSLLCLLLCLILAAVEGWSGADRYRWPLDNLLRLLDFGDSMQIFGWRLHDVAPTDYNRALAVFFRFTAGVWMGAVVLYVRLAVLRGWGYTSEQLVEHLRDGDAFVRRSAAADLGPCRLDAAQVVPALVGGLEDFDREVRRRAVRSLGTIGPAARPAVPMILDELLRTIRPRSTSTPPARWVGSGRATGISPTRCTASNSSGCVTPMRRRPAARSTRASSCSAGRGGARASKDRWKDEFPRSPERRGVSPPVQARPGAPPPFGGVAFARPEGCRSRWCPPAGGLRRSGLLPRLALFFRQLAQAELLDLARHRHRELLDEPPAARHLVRREVRPAERLQFARRGATPGAARTQAITSSPYFSLGTPITWASATAGWRCSTSSISRGEMFSPPRMIMSLIRPTMCDVAVLVHDGQVAGVHPARRVDRGVASPPRPPSSRRITP